MMRQELPSDLPWTNETDAQTHATGHRVSIKSAKGVSNVRT